MQLTCLQHSVLAKHKSPTKLPCFTRFNATAIVALHAGLTLDSSVSEDTIDGNLCLAVYGTIAGMHETAVFTFSCEEESDTEEWSTALTVCLAAFKRPGHKVKPVLRILSNIDINAHNV
jgi:hypothetical protein